MGPGGSSPWLKKSRDSTLLKHSSSVHDLLPYIQINIILFRLPQNNLPVSQQLDHNGDIFFAQDFGSDFHPRVLVAREVRFFVATFCVQMMGVLITEPWVLFSVARIIN